MAAAGDLPDGRSSMPVASACSVSSAVDPVSSPKPSFSRICISRKIKDRQLAGPVAESGLSSCCLVS